LNAFVLVPFLNLLFLYDVSASKVPHGASPLPTSWYVPCLPILTCLSRLHMCGLILCPFSGSVCDLLSRGGRGLSPVRALPRESPSHNLDEHYLEDTEIFWYLTYPGARRRRGFSRAAARHNVTTKLWEILCLSNFLKILTCGGRESTISRLATLPQTVASGRFFDLRRPQVEKMNQNQKLSLFLGS